MKWLLKQLRLLKKARADLNYLEKAWHMRNGVHSYIVSYATVVGMAIITILIWRVMNWCLG